MNGAGRAVDHLKEVDIIKEGEGGGEVDLGG